MEGFRYGGVVRGEVLEEEVVVVGYRGVVEDGGLRGFVGGYDGYSFGVFIFEFGVCDGFCVSLIIV